MHSRPTPRLLLSQPLPDRVGDSEADEAESEAGSTHGASLKAFVAALGGRTACQPPPNWDENENYDDENENQTAVTQHLAGFCEGGAEAEAEADDRT